MPISIVDGGVVGEEAEMGEKKLEVDEVDYGDGESGKSLVYTGALEKYPSEGQLNADTARRSHSQERQEPVDVGYHAV